ncbi:DUF871 domain-containing protein [Erysipelothrix sp. HDW6A]|uniref:MupG family TIM beta-alpha barrel fold protein n=1 Tax=Erysipelothrix sp. HDW6A TaxID=2714928 RepID=UPI00140C24C0|nr:MupG family TIM beta-alpha barrel fold protein [Erysipelothrix sp. HDW6A]QIK58200.1 DUF871 domain-containing protein [Erysipelothrix sp. HDW6A]
MFGISTYIQDLDYSYIEQATKLGAKFLFSSLHIPEENYDSVGEIIPSLLKKCKEIGLIYVPDVSPRTFEKLGIENNDYSKLKEIGISALRLDHTVEDFSLLAELMNDFTIFLNASTVTREYLDNAIESGIDVTKMYAMHNFYPKTDTALDEVYFDNMNQIFKEYRVRVMAFVVGDKLKRFPLYEGLPTLESHRDMDPYIATIDMVKTYGVDDVVIGDSEASMDTLSYISEYMYKGIVTVPVAIENSELIDLGREYGIRRDLAKNVVRLAVPRQIGIKPSRNNSRYRGAITIENILAQRYCGEIQIIKRNLEFQSSSNVIGEIPRKYLDIVDFIDENTRIVFHKCD